MDRLEEADSGRGEVHAESETASSLAETERVTGEAGGGIATALGIRARGVLIDGRPIAEDPAETRPPRLGFGVLKGDCGGRVGDEVERELREGEGRVDRAGLAGGSRRRDGVLASRELSCLAVMETYLDAREPAVSFPVSAAAGLAGVAGLARTRVLARAAGVVPGVARPAYDGVMRPPFEGVVRPVDMREVDAEGVIRELVLKDMPDVDGVIRPDMEGVVRPPREEATDEGRLTAPGPTVGADSFVVATKTPQLGGHEKYCFLARVDET